MRKKRKRLIILSIIGIIILGGNVLFVRSPIGIALLKVKTAFQNIRNYPTFTSARDWDISDSESG